MINERITIKGFLSYKDTQTIDFPQIPVCLVNGAIEGDLNSSNGAGKSSLFEAISVAAFGKTGGRAQNLDEYINDGMNQLEIEHVFKIDNVRFMNVFRREKGKSTYKEVFYDSNNDVIDNAIWKKCDKSIEDILGLSFNTYNSTVYLNERESLKFIDGSSSDRKEILRELLNIKLYEAAAKKANDKAGDFSTKFELNSSMIQNKQEQLENEAELKQNEKELKTNNTIINKDLKGLASKMETWDKKRKEIEITIAKQKDLKEQLEKEQKLLLELDNDILLKNNDIKLLKEKFQKNADTVENNEEKIEKLQKDINETEKIITKLKNKNIDYTEAIEKLSKKMKEINKELKDKSIKISKLETEKEKLEELISKIDKFGNICPITENKCPIINNSFKTDFSDSKKEEIEKKTTEIKKLEKVCEEFEKKLEQINDKQNEYFKEQKEQEKLQKRISELEKEIEILKVKNESLDESLEEIGERGKELKKNLAVLEKKDKEKKELINELKQKIDSSFDKELEKVVEKIDELKFEQKGLQQEETKNKERLAVIQDAYKRNKEINKHITTMLKNNEELSKQKNIFLNLTSILGKEGIQKSIMKQIVPNLEQTTSELLKVFNGDSEKIQVKFELDPKKQDGTSKKQGGLDILVIEEGKEPKDLRMYSGGERVRIVFSIILGLAKILSKRSGKKHETLIVDEKIAKLDKKGIEQFAEVINEISESYKRIFIITHLENLKDLFNQGEILVNKTELKGSLVSVI